MRRWLCAAIQDFGDVDAEGCGQVVLVILLLSDDFAELLGEGVVAESFGLFDALAIIPDGIGFVVEVEAQHIFGLL